ncbi:hypothetical protein [Haloarchaeobius sp. HRN-SO-5]|uniref:hypothetical protein n=1 Tax=Haloarchaeobius sp. HRN-SO-5 TaxID=3446118 RepID=UPI003EBC5BAB
MSQATRSVRSDEPTLSPSLEPRPLTGETVVVDVDRRLLRGTRSALGYLDDSDRTSDDGARIVDAVRMRVDTLSARLDAQARDQFTTRFDAADLVLLVAGLFGVGRYYADDGRPVAADFHRQRAAELLGALAEQRPDLVDDLRRVVAE